MAYYFGKTYDEFLKVCRKLDNCYKIEIEKPYDMVLASAGGYPKDINFIQSHKAVHNAANMVKDGGTLVILAQCVEGIGSKTFLPWFDMGGRRAAFDALLENYVGNGGTALSTMEKAGRIKICLVSDLPQEICEKIGVIKTSLEQAVGLFQAHKGSLAIVENASLLVSDRK